MIAVKKDGDTVLATLERCKDGPEGVVIASRLRSVEIGLGEDGDAITSCVVDEAEAEEAFAPTKAKGPKLPDRVRLGLDVLTECALATGEPLPAHYGIPGNPRAVKVATWREALFSRGVLDREAKNPREDFARIKRTLLARHLV